MPSNIILMASTMLWVVGSIILALIIIALVSTLISRATSFHQKNLFIQKFLSFTKDVDFVCLQEVNNSLTTNLQIPDFVRVVYATDEPQKVPIKVLDKITNKETSEGTYVCTHLVGDEKPRCEKIHCKVKMPYVGTLPESRDIWRMISQILNKPTIKEYKFFVEKDSPAHVTVSILK